jgi:hypothetical protein
VEVQGYNVEAVAVEVQGYNVEAVRSQESAGIERLTFVFCRFVEVT